MKVFIPDPKNEIGGPSTFLRGLRANIKGDVQLATNLWSAEALFFPISFPIWAVKAFKYGGCPVIQRLDGIYYPEKHGDSYKQKNALMETIYKKFATHIIFQSKYSRRQSEVLFDQPNTQIINQIYNGCPKNTYFPASSKRIEEKVSLLAVGNFRGDDMIYPLLEMLEILDPKKFVFNIVGVMSHEYLQKFLLLPNVVYHGKKEAQEIAEMHRASDIFVFSHASAPCPNAVIEAISSALPVVSFNTGSLPELCGFNSELLAETPSKDFHTANDLAGHKLAQKVLLCVNNFEHYKKRALANAHLFSLDQCTTQYLQIFATLKVSYFNIVIKNVLLLYYRVLYLVKS